MLRWWEGDNKFEGDKGRGGEEPGCLRAKAAAAHSWQQSTLQPPIPGLSSMF